MQTCLGSSWSFVQVVNLVSNDVRRFDDIGPYYMHIWAGPLEVICVLVMVGAQLTFPAAIAGIATLLLLIPFQAGLLPFASALLPTHWVLAFVMQASLAILAFRFAPLFYHSDCVLSLPCALEPSAVPCQLPNRLPVKTFEREKKRKTCYCLISCLLHVFGATHQRTVQRWARS